MDDCSVLSVLAGCDITSFSANHSVINTELPLGARGISRHHVARLTLVACVVA